jgi:hypothetical protein
MLLMREALIEKAAAVTAEVFYDLHQGRGDTSMVEVDGEKVIRPYLPLMVDPIGEGLEFRNTEITDPQSKKSFNLTPTEKKYLDERVDKLLAKKVREAITSMKKQDG